MGEEIGDEVTIQEAIAELQKIAGKHPNCEVMFDCPHCNASFSPTRIEVKQNVTLK